MAVYVNFHRFMNLTINFQRNPAVCSLRSAVCKCHTPQKDMRCWTETESIIKLGAACIENSRETKDKTVAEATKTDTLTNSASLNNKTAN